MTTVSGRRTGVMTLVRRRRTLRDGLLRAKRLARLLRAVGSSRLGRRGPFHLSHLITGRCECKCPACLWRDHQTQELDTSTIEALYRGAGANGFVANAVWGGEPLLREDLGRLCHTSKEAGMITTIITNGYHLPDRAKELASAADSLIISLDYPDANAHDAYRGRPGVFRNAITGIELLKKLSKTEKITINCLLHRGNEEMMPRMAELARSLGVSLYVCPAKEGTVPDLRTSNSTELALRERQQQVALELLDLKKRGYPINNSRTYLREYLAESRPYTCRVPLVFVTVTPDGQVVNCFRQQSAYSSVKASPFGEIMRRWNREEALQAAAGCFRCNNPNVVDTSYVWALRPEPILNLLRVFSTS